MRILTCKNHTNLRWWAKDKAWNSDVIIRHGDGEYNGERNTFFLGEPTGEGLYNDGSGLMCRHGVVECNCPPSDLVLAPEDKLLKR